MTQDQNVLSLEKLIETLDLGEGALYPGGLRMNQELAAPYNALLPSAERLGVFASQLHVRDPPYTQHQPSADQDGVNEDLKFVVHSDANEDAQASQTISTWLVARLHFERTCGLVEEPT